MNDAACSVRSRPVLVADKAPGDYKARITSEGAGYTCPYIQTIYGSKASGLPYTRAESPTSREDLRYLMPSPAARGLMRPSARIPTHRPSEAEGSQTGHRIAAAQRKPRQTGRQRQRKISMTQTSRPIRPFQIFVIKNEPNQHTGNLSACIMMRVQNAWSIFADSI